jgi:hypothetical protein
MTQEIKGTLCFSCAPSWMAAEAQKTGAPSLPRFSMLAYTGVPMVVCGWPDPVVVDRRRTQHIPQSDEIYQRPA